MDILIAGVGGQGIILASRALAAAAVAAGLPARTAETIGMAQREGSVASHVRLGVKDAGALIPEGSASVLLALEPAEACRNLKYLRPGGRAIVSTAPVIPVLAALGSSPYPLADIIAYLRNNVPGCHCLDALARAREAGNQRTLNLVMLGALANFGLPFPPDLLLAEALKLLPPRVHDINRRAFELGRRALEV